LLRERLSAFEEEKAEFRLILRSSRENYDLKHGVRQAEEVPAGAGAASEGAQHMLSFSPLRLLSAIFSPFLTASAPGMQAPESVSIRRVLPRKETCVKSMRSLGLSRSFAVPEDSMESAAALLRSRLDEADGRNEG
ncbi:unnamed protein product, partial [Symbiodinium necroappetens]